MDPMMLIQLARLSSGSNEDVNPEVLESGEKRRLWADGRGVKDDPPCGRITGESWPDSPPRRDLGDSH